MLYKITKYISNRYKEACIKIYLRNKEFDPDTPILIFSDPRGGSTWLTELIHEIENTAVVWEPLYLSQGSYFNKLNFGWRQFIPKDAEWKEAKNAFELLFKGKILNANSLYLSTISEFREAENLIVKFCRGNALLPWLVNQFNFKYQPIYLVRHPFAVAASQMKQGGWNHEFNEYIIPKMPFNEIYLKHQNFLSSLKTKEESLVATWCITNMHPLKNASNNRKWITVNYEQLLLNPEKELRKIFSKWNLIMPPSILEKVNHPSITTIEGSPIENKMTQLENWKNFYSQSMINKLQRILDYFEIEDYSTEPLPLVSYDR